MGNQPSLTKAEKKEFLEKYKVDENLFQEMLANFKKESNKNQQITKEKFYALFGKTSTKEFIEQLFDRFDKDHNGVLDLNEFMIMLGITYGKSTEQKLRASFEIFDKNGDGKLTKEEVRDMFILILQQKWKIDNPYAASAPPRLNDEELKTVNSIIDTVFEKVDTDKNGTLDINEFITGFSTNPEVCSFFMQF